MEQNKIQMIGLDLDGTTLTTDKKLTPHTKEVLEKCLRNHINIVPSTGRVYSGIPDYLKQIEGIRYIITSNGGAVYDMLEDKCVYQNGISWERTLELCDYFESFHTYYDIYAMGKGWVEERFYDHLDLYNIDRFIRALILDSRVKIGDLRDFISKHKAPTEKMNLFFAQEEVKLQIFEELKSIPDIAVSYSLGNNLEINNATCNKGDALLGLAEKLGIAKENTMACGDGLNDLDMIKMAGVGVAMANAMEPVLQASDYITKTNDEEGVAYAIEKFCNFHMD